MKEKILAMLENDARLTAAQIAAALDSDEKTVADIIDKLEDDGVIAGYKAIINPEFTTNDVVSALIELKITPQRDKGFSAVAERIRNYPEIKSVYLMSGGFDLALIMEGRTMREIAYFVAEKLATIDGVTSTATHFVLQKYKDNGISFNIEKEDKRGNSW